MTTKREELLQLARDDEADCTIMTGRGYGKYTREMAERRRGRRQKFLFLDIDGVVNSEAFLKKLDTKHEAHRDNASEGDHARASCECYAHKNQIDPDAVQRLNRIVEAMPDLEIVLSSSWRLLFDIDEVSRVLTSHGFTASPIRSQTPDLANDADYVRLRADGLIDRIARGHEISYWLEARLGVDPRFSASVATDAIVQRLTTGESAPMIVILDDGSDMIHLSPWHVLTDARVGLTDADTEHAIALLTGGSR